MGGCLKVSQEDLEYLNRMFLYDEEKGTLTYKWLPLKKSLVGKTISPKPSHYGYRHVSVNNKLFYHHVICFCLGRQCTLGEEEEVDHRDRCKTNDILRNLRLASKSDNCKNRSCFSNNKLGYKCIHQRRNGSFRVDISSNNKRTYVGDFILLDDAIKARDEALVVLHGEFNYKDNTL